MIGKITKMGIAALLLSASALELSAQQLPVMNQYIYNPYLYNPARTGQRETGSFNLNFKKQWVAMPNSPLTGAMSIEAPLKDTRLGLGGMLYSDKMHIINRVGGLATAAYHLPFDETGSHGLSGGISLGVVNQRFAVGDATVANPNDPQLVGPSTSGTTADFSIGFDYHWKQLHVGLSMLQGLNSAIKYLNTTNGTSSDFTLRRHFLFTASYLFEFGEKKEWGVEPTLLARALQGVPPQVEFTALGNWRKLIYLGMGVRSTNTFSTTGTLMTTIGVNAKDKFFFGYTIDYGWNPTVNSSLGSQHELMVSFRFGDNGEVKKLKSNVEDMQRREAQMTAKLLETNSKVDSLNTAQNELAEQQKAQAEALKKQEAENAAMRNQLAEQNRISQEQQNKLNKHDQELEDIRKQLGAKNPMYKRLGSVTFDEGKTELTKMSMAEMDALIPTLKSDPNQRIFLYGRASTKGSRTANEQISLKRAVAARQYLISKGISGDNIEVIPFGASDPEQGGTKDNASDRRVDVYISK